MVGDTDQDGNPRIVNGRVNMGAVENNGGYGAWAAAIVNGLTNYTDSAIGDGYANLLKYATGSSPTNSDNLAKFSIVATNGLRSLRFNRNADALDVTLIVEANNALNSGVPWFGIATNQFGSWGGAGNVVETGPGMPVAVSVTDPAPSATNRFYRLRVTRP